MQALCDEHQASIDEGCRKAAAEIVSRALEKASLKEQVKALEVHTVKLLLLTLCRAELGCTKCNAMYVSKSICACLAVLKKLLPYIKLYFSSVDTLSSLGVQCHSSYASICALKPGS